MWSISWLGCSVWGLAWFVACVLVLVCPRSSALFPGGVSLSFLSCSWYVALCSHVGRCCCTVNRFVFTVHGWLFCYVISASFEVLSLVCTIMCCVFSCYTRMSLHCLCVLSVWCVSFLFFTWHSCVWLRANPSYYFYYSKTLFNASMHCTPSIATQLTSTTGKPVLVLRITGVLSKMLIH